MRKENLWPIQAKYNNYSEDDLFDIIEFLYDHISLPQKGYFHEWNNCGWHYNEFDKQLGQQEWLTAINDLLIDYSGYELTEQGEILTPLIVGTNKLFEESLPDYDKKNVNDRVLLATHNFRLYGSSPEEKKNSVKILVEVLEYLRQEAKTVITEKDEDDLFNLANNFGIRHHNAKQKTHYDQEIWLEWMFYYYLATINATVRLLKQRKMII